MEELVRLLRKHSYRINPQATLRAFRQGKLPDKTFSQLIAKSLGFNVLPGFVIRVQEGHVKKIYQIPVFSTDFFRADEKYCVRYDFREKFKGLEKWLQERPYRPKTVICAETELPNKIYDSISSGVRFQQSFFLLVQRLPKTSSQAKGGISIALPDDKVYVEVGPDIPSLVHKGQGSFGVISDDKMLGRGRKVLSSRTIREINRLTREMTLLLGSGTTIEWLLSGLLYLSSAQRSVKSQHAPLTTILNARRPQDGFRVASSGIASGLAIPLTRDFDSLRMLLSGERKYVFVADNPRTEFSSLIPYAKGFLFRRGSLLCHLVILLRERGVPCIFSENIPHSIKQGSNIFFNTYEGKFTLSKKGLAKPG